MSAGWFPDPENPSLMRYWDGTTWTEHTSIATSPAPAPAPVPPSYPPPYGGAAPPKSKSTWWIAPVAVVVILGLAVGGWFAFQALSGPATLADIEDVLAREDVTCQPGPEKSRSDFLEELDTDSEGEDDETVLWSKAAAKAVKAEAGVKQVRLYYCWEDGIDTADPDEIERSYTDVLTVDDATEDDRPILVTISPDNDFASEVKDLDVKVLVDPLTVDWVTDDFLDWLDDPEGTDDEAGG